MIPWITSKQLWSNISSDGTWHDVQRPNESVADPIFGIATGIGAFFIWENDRRNAHDHGPGNTLLDLLSRRMGVDNYLRERENKLEISPSSK